MDKDRTEFRAPEALREMKEIVKEEIGEEMMDNKIEETGIRLLTIRAAVSSSRTGKSLKVHSVFEFLARSGS